MLRRTALLAFAALATVVLAGEAEKPQPKEKPALPEPTDDDVHKPGKAGVPPPQGLPDEPAAEEPEKEGEPDGPKTVSPFSRRGTKPKYALPARITCSDGTVLQGYVWRRSDSPIRLYNRAKRAHEDYFLSDLRRIDVRPETETFERDWRWKNQGSSEMVFLDVGYFWNQYLTTFTTADGGTTEGDCSGQFYILTLDDKKDKWYLYKRHSARDTPHKKREELKPLVYVKSVEFTDDFLKKDEEKKIRNP